jgi:hypothetical protein
MTPGGQAANHWKTDEDKECYCTVIDPWLKESKGMAQRQILVSALVRRIVMVARSLRREIPALS